MLEAKDEKSKFKAYKETQESRRQGSVGYARHRVLHGRPWGLELEDIRTGHIRWYHGDLDSNTSADAARATTEHANRLRKNIEYKEYPGLDHFELQQECSAEAYAWLKSDVNLEKRSLRK